MENKQKNLPKPVSSDDECVECDVVVSWKILQLPEMK